MKNIKRIAIIGNAGSGKSTLAKKLHDILNLPLYHLDQYFWGPNWTRPNVDEYKLIHDDLCIKDKWIIDGMNLKFLDYRAEMSEVIIFLNFPRYICFWRIFKRLFKYYGKEAPSSAKGCYERISFEFLSWVWSFKKRHLLNILNVLGRHSKLKRIYIIKSQKDLDNCINEISS